MTVHQSELHRQKEAWKAAKARLSVGRPSRVQMLEADLQEARAELGQARRDVVRLLAEMDLVRNRLRNKEALIKRLEVKRKRKYGRRQAPGPIPDVAHIVSPILAKYPGVTWEAILSRRRTAHVVCCRHECVLAVRKDNPGLSLPQMGKIFRKHHTTILEIVRSAR